MPIPPLDEAGLLPEGVYHCTLEEVEERFGRFQGSDRRSRLFAKLKEYVKDVRLTGMAVALFIDGSFVTAEPDPSDIDLVLALRSDHDFGVQLRPFEYNVMVAPGARRRYRFDVFSAKDDTPELDQRVNFFQRIRGNESRTKGILRILL
jgi:hypothetical protein